MMGQNMVTDTFGNNNLITNEEELLAKYLRDNNLAKVNTISREVSPADNFYVRHVKRVLDLCVGIPTFLIALPFNVIFGICTFFDVGKPIFYKQTRIGKNGEPFLLIKFRNMNEKTDADGKMLPPKERVTRFGRFMRKYSLDELLNFWSVIKGDMSIIGPRPLPVSYEDRMSERHKMRSLVRPGLECPRMNNVELDQCQYQNQFENDIWYVENVSFLVDVKMLFMLFKMTVNVKKRSKAAEGNGYFAGYDHNCVATTLNRFKRMYPDLWREIQK